MHHDVILETAIRKLQDTEEKFLSHGPEYKLTPTVEMTVRSIPAQISIMKDALNADVNSAPFSRALSLAKAILGHDEEEEHRKKVEEINKLLGIIGQ